MDQVELKKVIIRTCGDLLRTKLDQLTLELKSLLESAESDTKSSMGDKYETGREMIMQERNKLEEQRSLLSKQLSYLTSVDTSKKYQKVEFGALVVTDSASYFICTALGMIEAEGQRIFVVSANSPVGQGMLGKKEGEKFVLNNRSFSIHSII